MRFATTVALLASAASAVSAVRPMMPYKPARRMAFMPLPGQSLARRDSNGYIPEETKCNNPDATTCEGACGQGFTECAATDKAIHCFNPAAGQVCCPGSNGNSCEAGYYCTHDEENETFCCPEGMDTAACAAAYTVSGGLVIATETSSSTSSSSTSSTPKPKTTEEPTPTPVYTTVTKDKTTSICTTSTPVYTHHNTTMYHTPTKKPTDTSVVTLPTVVPEEPSITTVPETPTTVPEQGGASTLAGSGLLLVAAGFIALL